MVQRPGIILLVLMIASLLFVVGTLVTVAVYLAGRPFG